MYALWPCTSVWRSFHLNVKKSSHLFTYIENCFPGQVSCLTSQANRLMDETTAFCPGSRPEQDSGGFGECGEAEAGNKIEPNSTHMVADEARKMRIFDGGICCGGGQCNGIGQRCVRSKAFESLDSDQ